MEYASVEQGSRASGLRLVLTAGVPGPWSEAAKGVLQLRNVNYLPVLQHGGGENAELLAWTGRRNAPTAMYNDEPPRLTAQDIIHLAERLGSGPSLLPPDIDDRVVLFGLLNEIAGEQGMAWNARTTMFSAMIESMGEEALSNSPMLRDYNYSAEEAVQAPARVAEILTTLAARLQAQSKVGSRYFIGQSVTALDVYWACFSQMLVALPPEVNPMPDYLRRAWGALALQLDASGYDFDPILLAHRNYIFANYLKLPLDY